MRLILPDRVPGANFVAARDEGLGR
jgi:hypothetical protein